MLGINEPPVTIKNIEKNIVERGFMEGWIRPEPPKFRTGRKLRSWAQVRLGLAAAQQLNRSGHWVTVYEKADRIGGLLRYGIPEFKLEKHIIDRRIEQMEAKAFVVVTDAHVGKSLPVEDLQREFDAIVLAGGREPARPAGAWTRIEGHPLRDGFPAAAEQALCHGDTLETELDILAAGKRVVIIGGGDTGADCLGTSHRQKPFSVHQFEIMPMPPEKRSPQTPWPLWPMQLRVEGAHEEGGVRGWSIATSEVHRRRTRQRETASRSSSGPSAEI